MKIYTGTSWSEANQKLCAEMNVGMMPTPVDLVHPDSIIKEVEIAGDNGAFRYYREKKPFDEKKFSDWLRSIERGLDWVALPDVVMAERWQDSYEQSVRWIGKTGFKEYFVVQDGMEYDFIHAGLSECDGCFIGGSTNVGECSGWKWKMAPHWIERCKEIGLPVHMGRCPGNTIGIFTAQKIGISSIDTSSLIRNQTMFVVNQYKAMLNEQTSLVEI